MEVSHNLTEKQSSKLEARNSNKFHNSGKCCLPPLTPGFEDLRLQLAQYPIKFNVSTVGAAGS